MSKYSVEQQRELLKKKSGIQLVQSSAMSILLGLTGLPSQGKLPRPQRPKQQQNIKPNKNSKN